jgi:hypothetical protein
MRALWRFPRHIRGRHDVNLVPKMIERQHAIKKHQHAIGNIEIVVGMFSDILQLPDDVVGAISNGSGGERRQAFHRGRAMCAQQFFHHLEDFAGAALDFASALDRNVRPA